MQRRLYQGTFDAIQHALPNTVITSDLLIHLRNMMAERGYETPCGICYVESRRRNLGTFTERFLKDYAGDSTGYKPTMDDLTTVDGLEAQTVDSGDKEKQRDLTLKKLLPFKAAA